MNTETIYTITAACTLIAAGITSFPYRLSYGNTSWLPWWMQPDSRYLERPYEYDYPARNINLLFSVSVVAIGILSILFVLRICPTTYRQKDGLPPLHFFTLPMPSARYFSGGRTTATASAMPAGLRHSAMERYIRFF